MGLSMAGIPLWAKCLPVVCLGALGYSLLQAAEFSRQDYELTVCAANATAYETSVQVCEFDSASNNIISEGAVAVASMGAATLLANVFAPPVFAHMHEAFIFRHFCLVLVWFFFCWALTLVPFVYTCYLLYSQAHLTGGNLYVPADQNQSDLLLAMGNPCNPNSYYCLSITPGLLAGFGYLFAGATAFWTGWLVMDDTANRIIRGEDVAEDGDVGAYYCAAPGAVVVGDQDHLRNPR